MTEVGEDRIRLAHPDGRPRHLTPSGDIRYRLGLYETAKLRIREGERLRWTRNDTPRGLINGEEAEVRAIGANTLTLRVAGGRDIAFARNDPQLRHLAYAYASTVHGAQGQTHERVIAVLDSGFGHLSNQQTFYVQLSRARENAVVLTDNREQLIETLEANTGERITALEAIGEAAVREVPAKAEVVAGEAAAFVERLRTEREHDAAAAAARETAHRVDTWLDDAERTLLPPRPAAEPESPHTAAPRFADGYEHEEWRHALEALVTEGRTTVREAVESQTVDVQAAARARDTMKRLERVLADERARAAERLAVARAQDWFLGWCDAEDPEDPFRPCSPTATVEEGRRIAADPALTDDWRRDVIHIVDGHDARNKAVSAAFDSPEAPVRIERGRVIRYSANLPTPLKRSIAAIIDAYGAHYAERERQESPRSIEAEFDRREAQDGRQATLDAARTLARRAAAEALRESDGLRRALDRHSRDGSELEASAERCHELAVAARRFAPNLPRTEASNLAEAVREAGRRLRRRLIEARRRLQSIRDRFQRVWPNHYHDRLRAGWDAYRVSDDFHPENIESHRPWIDGFRDLVRNPHLDPDRCEELDTLLHDYDTSWPQQRARYLDLVERWNALGARAGGGPVDRLPEYRVLLEELRRSAGLDTLTKREREAIHNVLRTHDEHLKKSLQRSMDIGL